MFGIALKYLDMNTKRCKKCLRTLPVESFRRGVSPCRECENKAAAEYRKTDAAKRAKAKYRASAKGIATERAREQRPEVKEFRRQQSRSERGRQNKKRYEATPKGKMTRKAALQRYRKTERAKILARLRDKKRSGLPHRKELNKRCRRKRYAMDAIHRTKVLLRHSLWAKTEAGHNWYAVKSQMRRAASNATNDGTPLTPAAWATIKSAAKGKCYYCRQKVAKLTMDHVIPLSKGGTHTVENIVAACLPCNCRKRAKIVTLF